MRTLFRMIGIFIVLMLHKNVQGAVVLDSVYYEGDRFMYHVEYEAQGQSKIIIDTIEVLISGKQWEGSPRQLEAIYTMLNYYPEYESHNAAKYGIDSPLSEKEVTGFIDNDYKVWNHPIRVGDYFILELAAFPNYIKNSRIGDKWKSLLIIGEGWGRLKGRSRRKYTVMNEIIYAIKNKELNCLEIIASSRHSLGKSKSRFLFSPKVGFVSIAHQLFNGDKVSFQMIAHSRLN